MSAQITVLEPTVKSVDTLAPWNASVYVSEQMTRQLANMAQDLAQRCVTECANRYSFDAEEAIRLLGLNMIRLEHKVKKHVQGTSSPVKSGSDKPAFPLPYSGEFNDSCCYALRQNNGLYTQCTGIRRVPGQNSVLSQFCKSCATTMQKAGAEMPEYGTIQQRLAVGIFEYSDPKGRKPVAYTKVMKKYKVDQEQVLVEAGKFNIVINPEHFVVAESESKRGRPKTEKEPKAKGAKGRPKKSKKVLLLEGDEEDLFATLVAEANDDEELVSEELISEDKKQQKEALVKQQKEEKEALAKQKKEALVQAREAKKKAEEDEKAAKKKAFEEAKALAQQAKEEKAAKLAAEKALAQQAKEEKEALAKQKKEAALAKNKVEKKPAAAAATTKPSVEDDEPDVVKKIEFEGKKYLKSKKTGIVYDYNEYVTNGEQVFVGKWNETTNKIDFTVKDDQEEEEEEYDTN